MGSISSGLEFTNRDAMARLRGRVSGGIMLLGWFFPTMGALTISGESATDRTLALLLLAPMPVLALFTLWRGSRLGDLGFIVIQCVVEILLVPVTFLTQPPGSLAGQEIAFVAPVVIVAVFAGRRAHVGLQVLVTIACAVLTSVHRIGLAPDLGAAIVPLAFAFVCVAFVVRLLRDLAHDAVRRAELGEVTDPLTGLLNRKGFERTGLRAWNRRSEEHLPLAVLLIDVDHFKRVNDTLGHAAGDELLRQVAQRLNEETRTGDHAYRLGGEEFAVLAPCRPGEGGVIAERIRRVIEQELPVTVSIGVLEISPSALDVADPSADGILATLWRAVDSADQGLYDAKRGGRNQVIVRHSAAA